MNIRTDDDLRVAVENAGVLLQEIQDYLAANQCRHRERANAKVRFPRGFIRPAPEQRARLTFVGDKALKDNLAYTLILSDTVLWLSLRTDLWGIPREMLTKLYVFLIGTLVESITKDYLSGHCGKNFKSRNTFLVDKGVIDPQLKIELDWLWETRNRMHLFQLENREYKNEYDNKCHARCVSAFRSLLDALSSKGRLVKS